VSRARGSCLGIAGALLGLAAAAPSRAEGPGIHVVAGYFDMTHARRSARALFGSTGGVTFGGGVSYAFGRGPFVEAGTRYFSRSGQRVFVAERNGPVFPLGHPLRVTMLPTAVTLGYRFRRTRALTPYAGLGGGFVWYRERSTVGGLSEIQRTTRPSGHLTAGAELRRGPLRFAAEASYSRTPNLLGVRPDSVAKVYGEKDAGGLGFVLKLGLSRSR
jgi:opacity protein-like surface antigen